MIQFLAVHKTTDGRAILGEIVDADDLDEAAEVAIAACTPDRFVIGVWQRDTIDDLVALADLYRESSEAAAEFEAATASIDAVLSGPSPVHAFKLEPRPPRVHVFSSSRDAYNLTQTSESIADGDVLLVPSEELVGVLVGAWPTRVVGDCDSWHELDHVQVRGDVDAELVSWANLDGGRYLEAARLALEWSHAKGRAAALRILGGLTFPWHASAPGAPPPDVVEDELEDERNRLDDVARLEDEEVVASVERIVVPAALTRHEIIVASDVIATSSTRVLAFRRGADGIAYAIDDDGKWHRLTGAAELSDAIGGR